jgi:hypothetical protein
MRVPIKNLTRIGKISTAREMFRALATAGIVLYFAYQGFRGVISGEILAVGKVRSVELVGLNARIMGGAFLAFTAGVLVQFGVACQPNTERVQRWGWRTCLGLYALFAGGMVVALVRVAIGTS